MASRTCCCNSLRGSLKTISVWNSEMLRLKPPSRLYLLVDSRMQIPICLDWIHLSSVKFIISSSNTSFFYGRNSQCVFVKSAFLLVEFQLLRVTSPSSLASIRIFEPQKWVKPPPNRLTRVEAVQHGHRRWSSWARFAHCCLALSSADMFFPDKLGCYP